VKTRLIVSLLSSAILVFIGLLLLSRWFNLEPSVAKKLQINPEQVRPTIDVGSPAGVYIPPDLATAVVELRRMLPSGLLRRLALSEPSDAFMLNYYSGQWLISHWNLDTTSPLSNYFRSAGIRYPEYMSAIVFDALVREVSGRPWTIAQELECGRFLTFQRDDPSPRSHYTSRCTF